MASSATTLVLTVVISSLIGNGQQQATSTDWWKHAVFYQIYPKSFMDSNNDGTGDLKGITQRLSHLKDAGVTATWLSPIYKSPQIDAGYDISDYKDIQDVFGTLADFEAMVAEANKLGVKIIMDFVPNHSSDQHEWFTKSVAGEENYADYYVWKDCEKNGNDSRKMPNNWISVFGGPAWTYSETRNKCYLHQFLPQQPDLNLRNPAVINELKETMKFWLDKGIAGFRMDAVPYLIEENFEDEPPSDDPNAQPNTHAYLNHIYTKDVNASYDVLYDWRAYLDAYTKENGGDERIMMTEAYADIEKTMLWFGNGEKAGAHFTFNFGLIGVNKNGGDTVNATKIKEIVVDGWLNNLCKGCTSNWVMGNHDNFRVATRAGPENTDLMNVLLLLLPGVAVTYYGEEIGMENGEVLYGECDDKANCDSEEHYYQNGRDFERTPFHWDTTTNAGFNEGQKPWLPVSQKYLYNNLKDQSAPGYQNSHYQLYKSLVQLRQKEAFLNDQGFQMVAVDDNVLTFVRSPSVKNTNSYVVVLNFGSTSQTVDVSSKTFASDAGITDNLRTVIATGSATSTLYKSYPSNAVVVGANQAVVLTSVLQTNEDWWKHAVFYQIYPRSFMDNNGDGIGDLQGIISKLDHLKDAGITAAWLSPIYTSPQVDMGYDISDYMNISEDYGSLDDLKQLVTKANELGLKIIMDFVPNHSSDEHEWFVKSEAGVEEYKDFYVWRDPNCYTGRCVEPNNWNSIFKYSAWKYSENRKKYYLHQFAEQQPDLNYRNDRVVSMMKEVLRFWLDLGVSGFRMDAVPYLIEDENFPDEQRTYYDGITEENYEYFKHEYSKDQQGTYDIIYFFRNFIDTYSAQHGGDARVIMTEAYTTIENTMRYYGDEDTGALGAHFSFNFFLITDIQPQSSAKEIVTQIKRWMTYMPLDYTANWVLGNHDQHRMATRLGPANVDGFHMVVALLPGISVSYNGEEIGQEDGEVTWDQGTDPSACNGLREDFEAISRDFERTPFHWDNTTFAGFTSGSSTWLPVSVKNKQTNLADQNVPGKRSTYNTYKAIIKLRQHPVFSTGTFVKLDALSDNVLAFTREQEGYPAHVVVFNRGNNAEHITLEHFGNINPSVKVVLASTYSLYREGDVLNSRDILLDAHESLVAENTEESVVTEEPTTTADPGAAAALRISLLALVLGIMCVMFF